MSFTRTKLSINQLEIDLQCPTKNGEYPAFYLFAHEKHSVERLEQLLDDEQLILAFISVEDWHDAMTPWPGESLFKNQPDFGGQADQFIPDVDEIVDAVDAKLREYGVHVRSRHLVGFSLSAIFCLYIASKRPIFQTVIAISPSAWYEGIVRYFKETPMPDAVQGIYLSLGEGEADNQNERISTVEERTEALESIFTKQGINVTSSSDEGDHFDQMHLRMSDGIRWALDRLKSFNEDLDNSGVG